MDNDPKSDDALPDPPMPEEPDRDRYLWNTGLLSHPPYTVLRGWVDRGLDPQETERLEEHFLHCSTCAAEARDLRGFTDSFEVAT